MKRTRTTKPEQPGEEMMLSRVPNEGDDLSAEEWPANRAPEMSPPRPRASARPMTMPDPRTAGLPAVPPAGTPGRVRMRESRKESNYSYEYSSESGESVVENGQAAALVAPALPQIPTPPEPPQLMQANQSVPPPPPVAEPISIPPPAPAVPLDDPAIAWRAGSVRPPESAIEIAPSIQVDAFVSPRPKPWARYRLPAIGAAGAVLVGLVIVFAMKGGGTHPVATEPPAQEPTPVAAVAGRTPPQTAAAAGMPHAAAAAAAVEAPGAVGANGAVHPGHKGKKKGKAAAAAAAAESAAAAAAATPPAAADPAAQAKTTPAEVHSATPPPPAPSHAVDDQAAAELGASLK